MLCILFCTFGKGNKDRIHNVYTLLCDILSHVNLQIPFRTKTKNKSSQNGFSFLKRNALHLFLYILQSKQRQNP